MDLKTSALGRLEGRLRACFFSDSTLADFSDDAYLVWSEYTRQNLLRL